MRVLAWDLPSLMQSASKPRLKKSSQATSFAISVYHFSMPAELIRTSRSILAIVAHVALIGSSHFKIVNFEKPCEKSLQRSLWGFGLRMLNMPARLSSAEKAATFTYQSPFGEPSFPLGRCRRRQGQQKATSSGLMRTIGPAKVG
jgi:hypothetical protein